MFQNYFFFLGAKFLWLSFLIVITFDSLIWGQNSLWIIDFSVQRDVRFEGHYFCWQSLFESFCLFNLCWYMYIYLYIYIPSNPQHKKELITAPLNVESPYYSSVIVLLRSWYHSDRDLFIPILILLPSFLNSWALGVKFQLKLRRKNPIYQTHQILLTTR